MALDSFKVPRMDMWRRELYAAAGYKLYKYPDWRQRVKVMPSPSGPYSMLPFASNRRRFGRRGLGGSRVSRCCRYYCSALDTFDNFEAGYAVWGGEEVCLGVCILAGLVTSVDVPCN